MSHDIERQVHNHAAANLTMPLPADEEERAVRLAIAWYDAAARLGIQRTDVDATGGSLIDVAVRAVLMAGQTPTRRPAVADAVPPAWSSANKIIWFTTKQAAEHTGYHSTTLTKACEAGELHGRQRTVGGTWRIHVSCLDAWMAGVPCPHAGGDQR